MNINQTDAAIIAIFVVTLLKSIFDIWLNPKWYRVQKNSFSTVEAVEKKRKRDSIAAIITLSVVSILTLQIIGGAVMTKEIARGEFDLLAERVKVLEDKLDPTGGGPTGIYEKFETLSVLVNEVASKYVPKDEFERLADAVAELKNKVQELYKPRAMGMGM